MKFSKSILSALLIVGAVAASAPSAASDGTVQALDEQFTVSITLVAPPKSSPLGDTNVFGNPETVSEDSTRVEGGETIRVITY